MPAAALLALPGCSGDDEPAVVRRTTRTSGLAPGELSTPTPLPPPELILASERVFQGGTVLASLVGEVKEGSVTFLGRTYPLTQGSRSIYAFLGVAPDDPPGLTTLKFEFTMQSGSKGTLSDDVTIIPTAWTFDAVTVPKRLEPLLVPSVQQREIRFIAGYYERMTPEKLWKSESAWLLPVPGILTTRFGEERTYNGGPPAGHHTGTDLGAGDGDPVQATNAGRIAMARQVDLRGNMVIVDHGGGLMSGYAHLKSFAVAEGQAVEPGDIIGFVGSSGLSTGAHLHWEMAAHGILVDALRFTDGSNGF